MSSTIIIITPPPTKPKRNSDKIESGKSSTYEVEVGEGATDLEALKALVLKLENADK